MDKAKRIDRVKNIAIALLLVSALWLLYRAVFYESASSALTVSAGQTQSGQTDGTTVLAAKPVYVLVTGQDGTHTAAKYDREAREKILSQFSAPFGEALGSADDPKRVETDEWHTALRGSGVFFDYLSAQPLRTVAESLGTVPKNPVSDVMARRFYLSVSDGAVRLYYINADDGSVYRCTTALSASSLLTKLGDYSGGTAKFAFENGEEFASLDPCFIFSGEEASLDAVSAANAFQESGELSKLFTAFGMSNRASTGYIEKSGAVVYVEGSRSLRSDSSGSALFSVADKEGIAIPHNGSLSAADIVSACAGIAERTIGESAGSATLVLTSYKQDETSGSIDVSFGYSVGGTPVTLAGGSPAATFKISGDSIVRAELLFRKYSYTGEKLSALPELQAAAIARSQGGEPVLTYNDAGDGVTVSWIIQ